MTDPVLAREIRQEIEALHRFFVGWFTGMLPQTETLFDRRFTRRFNPAFVLIPPGGEIVPLATLDRRLRAAHGSRPTLQIEIRQVELRYAAAELLLATYQEWQREETSSPPSRSGRLSTVLLTRGTPLRWLHVHECWLPAALTAAAGDGF